MAEIVRSTVSIRRRQRRMQNVQEGQVEPKMSGVKRNPSISSESSSSSDDSHRLNGVDVNSYSDQRQLTSNKLESEKTSFEVEHQSACSLKESRRGLRLTELSSRYADEDGLNEDDFLNNQDFEDDDISSSTDATDGTKNDDDYDYDDRIDDAGMTLGDGNDVKDEEIDDDVKEKSDMEDLKSPLANSTEVDDEQDTTKEGDSDEEPAKIITARVSHDHQYKLCYEVGSF